MRARPSKGNAIPTKSRTIVRQRDNSQCQRCGLAGSEWHHRRSRRVRDEHTHSPANGVLLCSACHAWAHAHPREATDQGLIISIHEQDPADRPIFTIQGWLHFEHDGGVRYQF